MSIAKLSNGTLLKIGDGAGPEVFTNVPDVRRLKGPSIKFDLLDVGSHSSPDLFREFIPGWSDGDAITGMGNWRPSNTVLKNMRIDAYAATKRNFKIVYPDTPDNTVVCATYIERIEPDADAGKEMTDDFRLKVTGAPVWS